MLTRKQIKAFEQTLLFHGTIEPFDTVLEPQSHGGCLWVAFASTVAQSYIPSSGGEAWIGIATHQLNDHLRPSKDKFWIAVYDMMGIKPRADTEYDAWGRSTSWAWEGGHWPTYQDAADFFDSIGYHGERDKHQYTYRIKTGYDDHRQIVYPADYKKVGRLFIFYGAERLNILNISRGESDLTDLQYHKYNTFERAKKEGYDGVKIDDFAQSRLHGNMGHTSVCLNSNGLSKLTYDVIPATNYDEEDWDDFTPEFEQYARKVLW